MAFPIKLRARGRTRPVAGSMNKLETAYSEHLANLVYTRELAWFRFEAVKLRLADTTFYTPDFLVMLMDGSLECHECKGFWTDDARVKIKVAADQYPFKFIAVKKNNGFNGGWDREEF